MKKLLSVILVLILFFCITGCEEGKYADKNFNIETDMQYYYRQSGTDLPMTESPNGYYYMYYSKTNNILFYVDKETEEATPLCSKPNCLHDNPNSCDAYFDVSESVMNNQMIQYYNGKLYILCGEYDKDFIEYKQYLLRCDLDGSNRKRVSDDFDFCFSFWCIHRGYLYYGRDNGIVRLSMDNLDGESEMVFEIKNYIKDNESAFQPILAYDHYLYFNVDEQNEEENTVESYAVALDLKTLRYNKIRYKDETFVSINSFAKGKVLGICRDKKTGEYVYLRGNLDGTGFRECYRRSEISTAYCDGNYYYFSDAITHAGDENYIPNITVLDLDMNEVDSFKLPEGSWWFNAQSTDCFIMKAVDKNNRPILVYADKGQLGSCKGKTIEYKTLCNMDFNTNTDNYYYEAE